MLSSCGSGVMVPASHFGKISASRLPPSVAKSSSKKELVGGHPPAPSSSSMRAWATIGPASIFSLISITETPVARSSAKMAEPAGEGPRNFGKSDGCMLSEPLRGIARIFFGMSLE